MPKKYTRTQQPQQHQNLNWRVMAADRNSSIQGLEQYFSQTLSKSIFAPLFSCQAHRTWSNYVRGFNTFKSKKKLFATGYCMILQLLDLVDLAPTRSDQLPSSAWRYLHQIHQIKIHFRLISDSFQIHH